MLSKAPFQWLILLFLAISTCAFGQSRTTKPVTKTASTSTMWMVPNAITLIPGHATIDDLTAGPGAKRESFAGSGKLRLISRAGGKTETWSVPVTFSQMSLTEQNQALSGTLTLGAAKWIDFYDSGFIVEFNNGSGALQAARNPAQLEITMAADVFFPFNDWRSGPYASRFPAGAVKLTLEAPGTMRLQATGGTTGSGAAGMSIMEMKATFLAGGCVIEPDQVHLNLTATDTAPPAFTVSCPSGDLNTYLPNLMTEEDVPLRLTFTNLQVNDNGEVTVANMRLPGGPPREIDRANPKGFLLRVTDATVSMERNAFTRYDLKAELGLPEGVWSDTAGRPMIKPLSFNLLKEPWLDFSGPSTPVPGPVQLQVEDFKVALRDLVVDLSRTEPTKAGNLPGISGPAWQGVFARQADILFPDNWKFGNKALSLTTTNCFVDASGFTGSVNAQEKDFTGFEGPKLKDFPIKLKSLKLKFTRNVETESQCNGSTGAPPNFTGEFPLDFDIAAGTARIEGAVELKNPKLGLTIDVADGVLQPDAAGNYALWLNGAMILDIPDCQTLQGKALSFHGLGINGTGAFVTTGAGDRLNLDVPANADFGTFRCNISSLGFNYSDTEKKWTVDLGGEISLNSDLPVDGVISCDTLSITESVTGKSLPSLTVGDIGVSSNIMDIAGIDAKITLKKWNNEPCLLGDAAFALTFLDSDVALGGTGSGSTGGFQFLVAPKGMWAVVGSVTMPQDIALGSTGLGIYQFRGGLAHNLTAVGNDFSSINALRPAPGSGQWLFTAGCKIGALSNHYFFHSDARLTIGVPDFFFSLNGDGWIYSNVEDPPGQMQVAIGCDPRVPSFYVNGAVDLGIPDPSIVRVHGTLGLLLSPGDTHLDIGWPYPENAVTSEILGGVLRSRFGGHFTLDSATICAGQSWDYWVFQGVIEGSFGYQAIAPYLIGQISASGMVDFVIASLAASATLSGELYDDYLDFDGMFTATIGTPWPLPDIDVSVDFSGRL